MELEEIRKNINEIDESILKLFLERMQLGKNVAEYKAENGLPILDRGRERSILERVRNESGDMEEYTHRLFTTLFELSRSYQGSFIERSTGIRDIIERSLAEADELFPQAGVIACQGTEGAYAQLAADRMFPRGSIVYFKTTEAVFDAVESGLCQYGILPIENSTYGSVRPVYELIQKKTVNIVRSERLCIRHELLAKPGVKLSEITEIHSHEQALGQCSEFLKTLGDKVKLVPCDNTAEAAAYAAKSEDRGVAAISSPDCAMLYGLSQLHTNIQNSDNNYTRFICITKQPRVYSGANRISLILSLEHKPGSLYSVMAKLAALGINLLKLESYPMLGHDFEFMFFFEMEASVADPKVLSMLEGLERECPKFVYLGNYSEV